ncbi:MAG: hypothetical protein UY94_C0008G0001 [Parcubacteria group bacterium GW2011_GWA2_56_21]|nr:MAG: hypothetical protein UY94_C0008G0001 [Parcubacteria group bacterium GW2011_GWA2_56_21]
MKNDVGYLKLMLDSFSKIRAFTANMNAAAFMSDDKTQSAVIMQFEVIGQLAKKVSEATRSRIDVPWKEMAGMRDWVAHDYFGLDLNIVWETVVNAAPKAEAAIRGYVKSLE